MGSGDLISFVQAMDQSWLDRRFDDLHFYLAPDVAVVAPSGQRVVGADAAIESYREFMSGSEVRAFNASNYVVTERSDAAIVEYAWSIDWVSNDEPHGAVGSDVLALSRSNQDWRVIWRLQLPSG